MRYKLLFIQPIFFIAITQSYSQTPLTADKKENLKILFKKKAESIQTLKCNFIQTKNISSLGISIESKGIFLFKKLNDNILWEYTSPNQIAIIISKGEFHIRNQSIGKNNMSKQNELFSKLNTILLSSINGEILENIDFNTNVFDYNNNYVVELAPKNNNPLNETLASLKVIFRKTDLTITEINLVEITGDKTNIIFQNMLLNTPISDSNFTY